MRPDSNTETGFGGVPFAQPVSTGPSVGVDAMTKQSIEGLPMTVSPDETLARNKALWPIATVDAVPEKTGDTEMERRSEAGRE